MLRPRFTIFSLISLVLCRSQVTVPTYCSTVTYVYAYFPAYFYFLKCIKNFANCFSLCYNGVMQRWSSWLMASASKAEEPQGSGGSNPSRCVFFFGNGFGYIIQIHCFFCSLQFFQECLGILAARCASCNYITYFYCAPLQSCRRLYQIFIRFS